MVTFEAPQTPTREAPIPFSLKGRKRQADSSPRPNTASSYASADEPVEDQILAEEGQERTLQSQIQQNMEQDTKQGQIQKIESAKILIEEVASQLDKELAKYLEDQVKALSQAQQRINNPAAKIDSQESILLNMQKEMTTMHLKLNQLSNPASTPDLHGNSPGTAGNNNPTFAEIVKKGQRPPPKIQVVIPQKYGNQPSLPNQPKKQVTSTKSDYKARRLIVKVPEETLQQLDPMEIRNQINKQFQAQEKATRPVIRTVARSYTGRSLILTTMEDITASYLIEKADVWRSIIPSSNYSQDDPWVKVVVHSVPTRPFQGQEGIDLLKQEIEIFNPTLKLMRAPAWLAAENTIIEKVHSSIIVYLQNEAMASQVIKQRICVAGALCKVSKWVEKTTQCQKCQKYKHISKYCRNKTACAICAKDHETRDHACPICEVKGQECTHTQIKCSNCSQNHRADSRKCMEWEKVRPKKSIPQRPIPKGAEMELDY